MLMKTLSHFSLGPMNVYKKSEFSIIILVYVLWFLVVFFILFYYFSRVNHPFRLLKFLLLNIQIFRLFLIWNNLNIPEISER